MMRGKCPGSISHFGPSRVELLVVAEIAGEGNAPRMIEINSCTSSSTGRAIDS